MSNAALPGRTLWYGTLAKLQMNADSGQQQEDKVATKEAVLGKVVCTLQKDEAGDYYEGSFCCYGIRTGTISGLQVWVTLHWECTDRPEQGLNLRDLGFGSQGAANLNSRSSNNIVKKYLFCVL